MGTCFQVAPGVLVTAWHVLDDIAAATRDAQVQVDPLVGGDVFRATVVRTDPVHDLAILAGAGRSLAVASPLAPTDRMELRASVTVTGNALPGEWESTFRFVTATGEWAGGTTRDDAVPLGRITASAVVPGMTGAPVIRDSDGAVAGVISGRYNSADGWPTDRVWVARTEDLVALLAGIADIAVAEPAQVGPVDLLLSVTTDRVRLTGRGIDVAADHGGVRSGLADAVNETRRARVGLSARARPATAMPVGDLALVRITRLLGESFLPEPVLSNMAQVLAAAERANQPVRLGLAVPPELTGLPWEALPRPDGRGPLALHPLVSLYRKTDAAPAWMLPGPMRIVVAIAAPDSGGPVLDYERELRNVLAAVRSARQDAAEVRVVPFATVAAIRDELDRGSAHVLHISGPGSPGILVLEDDDGAARRVTADEFADQAIPPGRMPPVVILSGADTNASLVDGTSFAARLCQRGAAAVIATETAITDVYATRLLARVYGTLARSRGPDLVAALSAARREVQTELETSPDWRDKELAGLGEWAAVTVLAATGSVPVVDPDHTLPMARPPSRTRIAGLAPREDWYFVGRRAEQRRWPADLTEATLTGIVIHGIGGTGKTTLAAEIISRVKDRDPSWIVASLTGPITLEVLLGTTIVTIRRELLVRDQSDTATMMALDVAGRPDLPWRDRLGILRDHVLDHVPLLLLLDGFEDNLDPGSDTGYAIRDEVLAELLAAWVGDPGRCRLLVTCRYRFALPNGADRTLSFRQLEALSRAETMKLAWSLPALDRLDEGQLEQMWRLAGGHPRSLEYLDALLSGGGARYPDVTQRLGAAVARRLSEGDRGEWLSARSGLDAALAEIVTLAADDVLLDELLTQIRGAAGLLLRISVYREPVDRNAVLFQAGIPDPDAEDIPDREAASRQITRLLATAGIAADRASDLTGLPAPVRSHLMPYIAELSRWPVPAFRPVPGLQEQIAACQAASLLTVSGEGGELRFFVQRWTATELAERAAREGGWQLIEAHGRASSYWQWRVRVWPQDQAAHVHDLLEARYHLLQAGEIEDADQVTVRASGHLHRWGAWDQEASLIRDSLARLPADSPRVAAWIHQLGIVAQARGDYEEATRHYERALDINELRGDQAGVASGYHQLGTLAQDRGDYDEAERQYRRALEINERLVNQAGMASCYHNLGILAQIRRDYDEAERQYRRALDIKERLGDQVGVAASYHQLGMLAQARGDYDEAEQQYQRSLDVKERLGNQAGMAASYHQLGTLAQDRRDYDEAERQYRRALDIKERLGNQAGMAASYHQLGMLAQARGDYEEAERQYQRSLDIKERLGNQAGMAITYSQLGDLEEVRGRSIVAAIPWHVKALVIRLRLGIPQAGNNLRRLAAYRRQLGVEPFASLLAKAADQVDQPGTISSLLDQFDADDSSTA